MYKRQAVLLASGCVHSVYSAFTSDTAVTDPALNGVWSSPDAEDAWEFSDGLDGVYTLVQTDAEGLSGEFIAGLFEVDGYRFIDLFPMTEQFNHGEQNPFYTYHFMPMHTIMLVKQVEPELILSMMDPEWVDSYLLDFPDAVPHEYADYLLLTGYPEELQDFLAEIAPLEGAFLDSEPMQRVELPAIAE